MAVPGKNLFSKHFSSNVYAWELEKSMARHLDFIFADSTPTDLCEECPAASPDFLRQVLVSLQASDNAAISRNAARFAAQCLDPDAPVPVAAEEGGDGKEEEPEALFRPGTIQRAQQDWSAAEDERREAFHKEKHRRTEHCKQQFATLAEEDEFDGMYDEHRVRSAPKFSNPNVKRERKAATLQSQDMSEDHLAHFRTL